MAGETGQDGQTSEPATGKTVSFEPPSRDSQKPSLRTGQRVFLKDLEKAPELNGHRGVIIKWKADVGRYAVRVAGKEMAIKPQNLQTEGGAAEAQKWAEKHKNIKGTMYNPEIAYKNVPGAGPKMTQWVGQMKAGQRIMVRCEQPSDVEDAPVPLWFGDEGFVGTAPVDIAILAADVGPDAAEWPKALSRVLHRFPAAAGRLRQVRRDGKSQWQIMLNNAGVPFTSASVPPCSLPESSEDLQRLASDEKSGFFDIGEDATENADEGAPLLRMKLIAEEGTSRGLLGLSFNHALCDIHGIGLLLRWLHHELDNTEKAPDVTPCHNRRLAEDTLSSCSEPSDAEAKDYLEHWPISRRAMEKWCFLARRIRAGCRGPHDGIATLHLSIKAQTLNDLKAEAVSDGAESATAFEAFVCFMALKLLHLGRHGRRCLVTKDYRSSLGSAAPDSELQNLFANVVTHGLSFELPGDIQDREVMPLAEACASMRCAIEAVDLSYIAWHRKQDHFCGLPNFFSSLCCNSWGRALADAKLVEAYAIGLRSVEERAANMSFPLDTAYLQVLPQPSGDYSVLLTMPLEELKALMKHLPESHFSIPHMSEIHVHPFRVPLPGDLMNRLSPLTEDISKTVRIACIGDSITACGYPKYLQAMFDRADLRVQVRNFGVAGATVQKFSDQPFWDEKKREDARQWRPHFIIFTFGTNDAKENNWDLQPFEEDYRRLCVDYLSCMHPRPVVFLATPPPLYEDGAHDMQQDVINTELPLAILRIAKAAERQVMEPLEKEAARCRSTVPEEFVAYTDIIDIFSALGGCALSRRKYFADDGVHPNERGTKLLTHYVFSHLRRHVSTTLARWRDAPKVVDDSSFF